MYNREWIKVTFQKQRYHNPGKNLMKIRNGFILVEIMIVVCIMGILAAIAIPKFLKARMTMEQKK